ncbi:MAG: GxxExxY protein [Candidatus Schekmanbacteria bacterium]|nr:GxxExxY protein [Candidatus Schekmanbacteria bacterium]
MEVNELTERIIGAAVEVHRELGPGLLESAYEACLAFEIADSGLRVERQVLLPLRYRGRYLDCGYRLDLWVERLVVVEAKAVTRIEPVHEAQLLSYLKLSSAKVGLIINFHVPLLKAGIKRMVLGLDEST